MSVSNAEAADAMLVLREWATQLGKSAQAHSENETLLATTSFSICVAGNNPITDKCEGHEMQIWLHAKDWAEHVCGDDPLRLAMKAEGMARLLDQIADNSFARKVA